MFRSWGIAAAAALCAAGPAWGDTVYFGVRNESSSAAPSGAVLAARNDFLSNFTGYYTVDFEAMADHASPGSHLGSKLSLPSALVGGPAVDPTPTATLVRDSSGTLEVLDSPDNGGYATSGSNFFWSRADFTIDFAPDPQRAFGFYATDVDDLGGEITVYWDTGGSATYLLGDPNSNYSSANLLFFGVVADANTSITKVSFTGASRIDGFRLDDVLFAYDQQFNPGRGPIDDSTSGPIVTAPLPTAALGGFAMFGVMAAGTWWRRRDRPADTDL
jgi:hypothetical protein